MPDLATDDRLGFVLAAGGSAQRFGGPVPKTLVDLAGRPVWTHSRETIRATFPDAVIVAVVPEDNRERFDDVDAVVTGGTTRADSVDRGLKELRRFGVVWAGVHDAARPLVTAGDLIAVVAAAKRFGAAILTTPVVATVKRTDGDRVTETIDRATLRLALTPQVARLDWLLQPLSDSDRPPTDESQRLERAGRIVHTVDGDPENLKITTASDLIVAEAILAARSQSGEP